MNAAAKTIDMTQSTGDAPATPTSVVIMPETAREVTPVTLLDRALAMNVDPATLREFMALEREHRRDKAKMAFDAAIAAAKAEVDVIEKNATGHNNKRYANFAAYAKAVDPVLSRHGLSYRFRSMQDERVHVTCILSHRDGHSEENTLSGPPDTTGNKNAIQAIGSTLTYLQRYSLVQALGLAASEDDDGRAAGGAPLASPEQVETVRAKIVESGSDLKKFLGRFVVEKIDELSPAQAERAIVLLDAKIANDAKAKAEAEAAS
jgi:hypothetical protein